jgi:hypothetical protein
MLMSPMVGWNLGMHATCHTNEQFEVQKALNSCDTCLRMTPLSHGIRHVINQTGMILGAKFCSWANFPWFFPKNDSLSKNDSPKFYRIK